MVLRPTIEIEIGELVLHGFDRRGAAEAVRSFGAHMEMLFASAAPLSASSVQPLVRAFSAAPLAADRPAVAAAAAARALFGALPR